MSKNSSTPPLCPVCGEGHLASHKGENPVEYGGLTRVLPLYYSACNACGSEIALDADTKKNIRAMNAFKKAADGLVSASELRDFRKQYGLSQALCAQLFGGGEVGFTRYENDDVLQSLPMDRLIRRCINAPETIIGLANDHGVDLPSKSIELIGQATLNNLMHMIGQFKTEAIEDARPAFSDQKTSDCANDNVFQMFSKPRKAPVVTGPWLQEAVA